MKTKRFLTFLTVAVLLAAGLVLTACTRSLSTGGGAATPTFTIPAVVESPEVGTDDVLNQLGVFATQTAIAAAAGQPTTAPEQGGVTEEPGETTQPVATEVPSGEEPTAAAPVEAGPTATQPVVIVPSPTPGIPTSYTLRDKEHPYCIARRFNVNPGELLNLNGISANQTVFRPGTTLKIPQTGNPFPGNRTLRSHPTTYTIQSGNSLTEIACMFGDVSPDAIAAANNLQPPYNLQPGTVLQIP